VSAYFVGSELIKWYDQDIKTSRLVSCKKLRHSDDIIAVYLSIYDNF